jgi:FlaA1/EpsC-like NDP-sugar epimerase
MIPRRFYWIFDFLILILAFLLSDVIAVQFHEFLTSKGILQSALIAIISPEPKYRQVVLGQNIWFLMVVSLPMIILLDVVGKGKWTLSPFTRIIMAGPAASVLGVGLVSLVLFSLQRQPIQISRTLLFTFGILSAVGLSFYRLAIREYYERRKRTGYYVNNVLIVGSDVAVAWMKRYFEDNINPNEYRIIVPIQ